MARPLDPERRSRMTALLEGEPRPQRKMAAANAKSGDGRRAMPERGSRTNFPAFDRLGNDEDVYVTGMPPSPALDAQKKAEDITVDEMAAFSHQLKQTDNLMLSTDDDASEVIKGPRPLVTVVMDDSSPEEPEETKKRKRHAFSAAAVQFADSGDSNTESMPPKRNRIPKDLPAAAYQNIVKSNFEIPSDHSIVTFNNCWIFVGPGITGKALLCTRLDEMYNVFGLGQIKSIAADPYLQHKLMATVHDWILEKNKRHRGSGGWYYVPRQDFVWLATSLRVYGLVKPFLDFVSEQNIRGGDMVRGDPRKSV